MLLGIVGGGHRALDLLGPLPAAPALLLVVVPLVVPVLLLAQKVDFLVRVQEAQVALLQEH